MKPGRIRFFAFVLFFLLCSAAVAAAGDLDWLNDFNIRAEADPSGFSARLAVRFHIGDAEVNAVLHQVERPGDAYLVLRFGEMSARPLDVVLEKYRAEKKHGWGAMAKSLGIKPGSAAFQALKRGDDLDEPQGRSKSKGKGKSNKKK